MKNIYHVKYVLNDKVATFKVNASSKQKAYDTFKKHLGNNIPVIDIVNHTVYVRVRNTLIIMLLFVTLAISSVLFIRETIKRQDPISYNEYVVRYGDTLWDIAKTSNGYGIIDTRKIVFDMCEESNFGEVLNTGDVVYIPLYNID